MVIVRGYFASDKVDIFGDIITKEAIIEAVKVWEERYRGPVIRIGEDEGLEWNEVEMKVEGAAVS